MVLNSRGEVADFQDVSQFIAGRSAYECVAYAGALIKYCGPPGKGPTGSTLEASNLAQYWYGREEGSTDSSNTNGMSLDAMYNMLQGMGLKYHPLDTSVQAIQGALLGECPVMLCGAETGMYDVGLGDIVPYSWTPTGNHCIVVSGVTSDINLLVHDCASISPSGVRPGPRIYDASKLQLVSVTAVIPPWQGAIMIPANWKDDGTTLTAPNGNKVVLGFRDFVLANNWDPANVPLQEQQGKNPLEGSNTALGAGDRQVFEWTVLEYTVSRGVFVAWGGRELLWRESVYNLLYAEYQKLKAGQPQPPSQLVADMKTVIAVAQKYII